MKQKEKKGNNLKNLLSKIDTRYLIVPFAFFILFVRRYWEPLDIVIIISWLMIVFIILLIDFLLQFTKNKFKN